jgi:phosphoribosylformylglycinamidine cyclo-ligase
MPGFYADGEYDIAGFIVGAVERARLIDGLTIRPGDALIGLPSSGLHTNGYSLARRVLFDVCGLGVDSYIDALGATVGEALLTTHRSYLPVIGPLLDGGRIKGLAHVTGGGITENLPRMLPDGCAAVIDRRTWQVPRLFRFIQEHAGAADAEMYRAFNMGIGLIVACEAWEQGRMLAALADAGENRAVPIGRVVEGDRNVRYVA